MKRTLLYILLLLGSVSIKAQTISGIVYRDSTQTAIADASVYYGGSMTGTITDKEGRFELQAKSQQVPITVSCIGYYSAKAYYKAGQPLIIYLKPKIEELHDVVIRADGMDRKNEVAIFIREFLGTSDYAKSCIITNINDVNLFYNKKTKTLTASSDKPIIVENKKLGYTISCYMDRFEKIAQKVYFSGNYIFKENKAANNKTQAAIQENREDAYDGSRMQLIRALWHLTLNKTFFDLYTLKRDVVRPEYSNLEESDLVVIDSLGQKYLRFQGSIYVGDSRSYRKTSILTFNSPLSFIDKDGFYGAGLEWSGPLGNQRVGDMLPLEYQSEREAKSIARVPSRAIVKASANSHSQKQEILFEKTYLHTDRDVYAQGDTLWFKAYLVNGQDNKPASSSGSLYVELLAPDSARILNREIIRMENGSGKGDMALGDSLPAGTYQLRAYTNWMRNFGDNFVFEKNITILNTQAVPLAPDQKTNNKKSITAIATKKTAAATNNTATNILPIVRFYPEGGSLINGISSFVGVKAEDGYGKGIPAAGAIISASGDTLGHFSCDSLGLGLFAILPMTGQSYHAVVDLAGGVPNQVRHDNFQLPAALNKGLALQVKQTDSVIHALVHAVGVNGNSINMVVKHSGKITLTQQFSLKDTQAAFKINTADLPEGISAITIYDAQNKPECERLVYVHHPNTKSNLTISTDKKNYQPKEQTTISIQTLPNANLSMAVVDAGIVPVQTENIVSYLNLQSEIKGDIESPDRYFDTTNVNRTKQLDLLLLTQGWRNFVWRRMADTSIRISYAAENGIPVTGRVWDEVRNKMLPNLNISLHADSAKGIKLFSAETDSAGRYHFDGLMIYGKQRIQLASTDDQGKDKGTLWLDTIRPLPVRPILQRPAYLQTPLDSMAKANTEKKAETMKAANLYGITRLKEVTVKDNKKSIITRSVNILNSREADQVFNITPDDYQYKTLEWYMLQKVKGAHESSQSYHGVVPTGVEFSGSDTLLVKGMVPFYVSKTVLMPPQIFVNGQELNMDGNTDLDMNTQAEAYRTQYFNMPMNKFKKVVLKHMSGTIHGLSASGKALLPSAELVNVDRYLLYLTMQDNYTTDNPGFLVTEIPGYYQARTFYEPPPNAKPSIADYRSTIHWEPDIKTDANGKATVSFYNAVPQTGIRVIVQGISDVGLPLNSVGGYKVN
jgi:hypothetical protein